MKVGKGSKSKYKFGLGLILIGLIACSLYFFLKENPPIKSLASLSMFCDAERIDGIGFGSGENVFSNSACQSNEESYSGEYSCKCTSDSVYSMAATIEDLKGLDTLRISAYIKNMNAKSRLVISSQKNEIFEFKELGKLKEDWKLVENEFVLPYDFRPDVVKVYAYMAGGDGVIYVDDLRVDVLASNQDVIDPMYKTNSLEMKIKKSLFNKIIAKREGALKQGLLFSSKEDLVEADLKLDNKIYSAEVRLKGDLLDHLAGDRWSYRIQLKGGKTWNGLKNFSIHNSKARAHVSEWIMHQIFLKEGIMTPAYDFLSVEINEEEKGVYAYEQHFDNQLLKYNKRQLGPILKHNDDAYWENVQAKPNPFPWTDASYIELFNKENKKDQNFAEQYENGKSMLQQFLNDDLAAGQVFDLDKMATYFALLDLSHALHAQAFTNIRFYLDPQSGLLEPIGFDCFGSHLPKVTPSWTSVGEGVNGREADRPENNIENVYQFKLLKDTNFYRIYMEKVNELTEPKYLEGQFKEFSSEIKNRELFIQSDTLYKDYVFSWDDLFAKAKYTRDKLSPKPYLSLSAYKSALGKNNVDVLSTHSFPLVVVGFGSDTIMIDKLDESQFIESYNSKVPAKTYSFQSSQPIKYVFYRALGNDKIYSSAVINNLLPSTSFEPVVADIATLKKYDFITIDNKQVHIGFGTHTLTDDIIIPKSFSLSIAAGTNILLNGGSILSYGSVTAIGSENNPISIAGDGAMGSAIMISGGKEKSVFSHCNFSNLSNYNYKNIATKGGVNVYRTDVSFDHCSFSGFRSKETISINYGSGVIRDCKVYRSKGDAISLEYSVGTLNNISIDNVGNTGIEITGGSCNAGSIVISNVLNNAIKVSNRSIAKFTGVDVESSETGLLAESSAKVILQRISFSNIERGVVVKNKSNDTTSAVLGNFSSENIGKPYQVQTGGILKINGSTKK